MHPATHNIKNRQTKLKLDVQGIYIQAMQQRHFIFLAFLPHYFIEKSSLSPTFKSLLGKDNTDFSPVKVSESGTLTNSPRCHFKSGPGFRGPH